MPGLTLGNLVWKIVANTSDFEKKLGSSESKLGRFAKGATAAGKTLTAAVTLPLLAAAGASVKFASDLQDSQNAVNVIFKEGADVINSYGETVAETAGLSTSAFNELATISGALLKQTGQSISLVAEQTNTLVQRGADLASVFGGSTKQAVEALNSALRGENEPARRYAINLSAAAVEAEALRSGLVNVGGELSEAGKIQARYNLILEASNEVQGDFANTNNDAKNSAEVLKASIVNLAAELGTELLPIVENILTGIRGLVERFSNLDEGQKRLILTVAGVAAAIGPVLVGIGALTTAIITLNTAALLGPLGIIAGVIALTVALVAFNKAAADAKTERLEEEFGSIAEATNQTVQDLELLNILLRQQDQFNNSAADAINEISNSWGIARSEVAKLALLNEDLSQSFREEAQAILDLETSLGNVVTSDESRAEFAGQRRQSQEDEIAANEIITEQVRTLADLARTRAAQQEAFQMGMRNIDALIGQGLITEVEGLQLKAGLREKEIESIKQAAIDGEITAQEAARQIGIQSELVTIYYDRLKILQDESLLKDEEISTAAAEAAQESLDALARFDDLNASVEARKLAAVQALDKERSEAAKKEEDRIKNQAQLLQDLLKTGITPVFEGFEDVGEAIVNGEDASVALAKAALSGLSQVLKALGAELAARSILALLSKDIPGFIAGGAGSIAAFTAAGAISAASGSIGGGSTSGTSGATPASPSVASDPESSRSVASSDTGGGSGTGQSITIVQNNLISTANEEELTEAARELVPYILQEIRRRGESL